MRWPTGHDRQGFGDWDARPIRPKGGQRIEYIRRRDDPRFEGGFDRL